MDNNFDDYYESLPDDVFITVKMNKKVFREMYSRTQEQEDGIVDERHVLNDWILGAIRHDQWGVSFFYESDATAGIPSVRFLTKRNSEIPPDRNGGMDLSGPSRYR